MMKVPQLLFFMSVATITFSCLKNTGSSNTGTPPEDAVIGNYLAVTVPPNFVSGSATVSKTSTGKYQFTPGSASIPSFSFQHDPIGSFFIAPDFSYQIPKQTSNTILLDSAYLTFYNTGARMITFTLTSSANGASWRYDGVKQ